MVISNCPPEFNSKLIQTSVQSVITVKNQFRIELYPGIIEAETDEVLITSKDLV